MRIIRTNLPEMAKAAYLDGNKYAELGFREYAKCNPVELLTGELIANIKKEDRPLSEIEKSYLENFGNRRRFNEINHRNY